MARLDTLEKGVGEVHNVYTRPEYRRRRKLHFVDETAKGDRFRVWSISSST